MSENPWSSLLRSDLADLRAYVPHEGTFEIRLDGNEAPPLLSAEAMAELAKALRPDPFCRYPDVHATELRHAVAEHSGAHPDEVLVGVGSDEVIAILLTALDRPRPGADRPTILVPAPTFVMYRHSGQARGFSTVEVPLDADWDLDVDAMKRAIARARPNLIFLATPNNPTSRQFGLDRIEEVIRAAPDSLVVVDEAYVAFAPHTQLHLRKAYPNVVILRTLSKIGFASLRLGWLVGSAALIRELDKIRQPYNLAVPTQKGATFVLRSLSAEIENTTRVVVSERKRLTDDLRALGFGVTESDANFLWVACPGSAEQVFRGLASSGILIKSYHAAGPRLAKHLRITVGLPSENDRLLHEIARCL